MSWGERVQIDELRAENARLRAALMKIVKMPYAPSEWSGAVQSMKVVAENALKVEGGK